MTAKDTQSEGVKPGPAIPQVMPRRHAITICAALLFLVSRALPWRAALAAFVLGLRFMPHPMPVSAVAMTAGILLTSAPAPEAAAFRAETIALIIAPILFLTVILERIIPWLAAAKPAKTDG